ncbi:DNA polymerase III subunit delta [Candidatus Saccharibacteria bacterium]|nr:DNA polymerase III subunit delta [Candidatus Saccharibacteria bacterium]
MIFYFYGDNSFAMRQQIEAIRARYSKKAGGELELERLDMAEAKAEDLLDSLGVMPMFATSRLVIAYNFSANPTLLEKFQDVVEAAVEPTILVIGDSKPDKRSRAFKALSKLPQAKEFTAITPGELQTWARLTAKKLGAELDARTASLLIERVGHDQWQLHQELQKLASYNSKITPGSIDELVVPNHEQTIFQLIDAVAQHKTARALELYKRLSLDGVADQQVLAMLNWQYRNLVIAKDNQGGELAWARDFGIAPFAANKAVGQARELEMTDLRTAYAQIVSADFAIKTGAKPSALALEQLLVELSLAEQP